MRTKREVIAKVEGKIHESNLRKITKEKAYIIGVLCGDGNLTKSCIRLEVVDLDFTKALREKVFEVYGYKGSIIKNPPRRWSIEGRSGITKPTFSFHAYGKRIVEDLLLFDRNNSYFKTGKWSVPERFLIPMIKP